ncbi:MAG: inverse autotransporter beta domain-containing protein, partial [Gemmobacter sp.]
MIHLAHAVLLGLVLAGAATAQEAPDDPPALAPESLRLQDELRALGAGLNAGRADVALEGVVRGRMRDAILDALDPLLPVPLAGRRAAEGAPAFEAAREIARRAQVRGTNEVRAAVARMAEGDPAALDGIGTRLVEGAGRDAIDSAIAALQARDPFGLAHLEITYDLRADRRPSFAVLAVKPLHEDARRGEVVFLQGSLARGTDDTTLNLGLAYRRLLGDGLWLGGANAFFDRALRQGLNRASVGLDLRSDRFTLSANRYIGLGGWRPGRPGYEVRALSGHDLELSGSLPGMPHLSLSGRVYDWDGAKPVSGREIALIYAPGPHLNARLGYADEGAGDTGLRASFAARYVFGVPLAAQFGAGAPERASVWDRRFEKVRRENTLRTEERIAPAAAGTILESTGANLILADTGTATAAAGASLPMPATIRVAAGAGAILRVRYGDGAILTLGAGSEVRSAAGVLTLIAGMMQYTSGSETRVIMVPGGQIDLLGTDIDLVVAGDDALVRVRSGAVRASSGPTAVVIAPRELARLDAAGATQVPPEDPVVIEHGAMIAGAIDSVATPMAGARMSPYPSAPPSRLSGGLVEGETIRFAVPFSGPVAVSGTPRLVLTLAGRERFATYAEGAGTETLLFDYVIAADDAGASELELRRLDVASGEIGTADLPAVLTFAPVTVDLGGTLRRADLEPPAGHAVAFGSGFEVVNAAEAGAVTVVISGAETGA